MIAPDQGLFPKYSEGLYREEGKAMVVSRGLGNSSVPIRLNNRPEVVKAPPFVRAERRAAQPVFSPEKRRRNEWYRDISALS